MKNNDLISRSALKEEIEKRIEQDNTEDFDKGYNIALQGVIELIDNVPTVEIPNDVLKSYHLGYAQAKVDLERPQGAWIDIEKQGRTGDGRTFSYPITVCSICKENTGELYNFCPNCGAKMISESEDK